MKLRNYILLLVLLMLIMGVTTQASAFSPPLNWNTMTMPSTTYNQVTNKLTVEAPGVIPVLGTNTGASQPSLIPGIGSYDPVQPWSVLNGAAFSRQLGWNDPNYAYADIPVNDPSSIIYTIKSIYGQGAGIWIECTGKSPELNNYLAVGLYGVNANDTAVVDAGNPTGYPYSGIFGTTYTDFVTKNTIVSPTRWQWDGYMDHNVNTVAFSALTGPNQLFISNYTVYIGNAAGNELRLDAGGIVHTAGEAGFDLLPSTGTTVTWQWKGPAFVFTRQTSVPTYAVVESDALKISGITGTKAISITGGEYAISTVSSATTAPATWGAWTAAPGTIGNNYWVKVRQTASAIPGTQTIATLAIPAIAGPGEFRVTTAAVVNVPVPNVVGTTQATAQSAITVATLIVGTVSTAHDAVIPAGSVISQNPVAASLVAPDTAVDLVISSGPAPVAVPNVVNFTQTNAQSAIIAATLTVGSVSQALSATVPSGSVISQNPVAGTSVLPGTSVDLVVSTGNGIPDGFSFTSLTGVDPSTVYESNVITVTGINVTTPISVSTGGSYAISTDNGVTWGAWVTTAGTVAFNNQVKVRNTSSATPATAVVTTLTIGGVSGSFSITTNSYTAPPTWMPMTMLNISLAGGKLAIVELATKSPFNTTPPTYPVLSMVAAVGTFDPAKPWAVLNGDVYSRRLGWNPASGFNAAAVQAAFGANAGIWIERISASPGLQTFQAVGTYGVNANNTTTVDPAANGYAPIFGTAGSSTKWQWDYKMDHNVNAVPAAYLTAPNQHFSATYRIYVGDGAGNDIAPDAAYTTTWGWTGPAVIPDNVPDAFSFTSQTGVAVNTVVESNVITVSGLAVPSLISITGGEYAVSTDSGATWSAWSASLSTTVANGNQVKVHQTSSATPGAVTIATLTIGGISAEFSVTTADGIPDGFSFTPLSGVDPVTVYASNAVTVTGINVSTPISISTGGSYAVSTDNGVTWGSWLTAAGTVSANNQVKVRRTSAATPTTEVITTLTIGGITGNFSLTTNSYTAPPTWMPMTMLNISLTAGQLAIVELANKSPFNTVPPTYPVLSTVAANGTFDPAKPWALLNGDAYSRRLGWNPASGFNAAAVQAAFGANAAIWIERISASPGLQTYQAVGTYGVNSNGTTTVDPAANGYSPIFGTAGSSTKWKWDYLMDHNVNAVPAAYITTPNQHFTATYRIYVGDSTTGTDIAPTAAYTTTWGWTGPAVIPDNVPDAFSFTSQTGVAVNTVIESNVITVSGLAVPSLISITGGEYAVSTDSGATWSVWSTSLPTAVANGNQVKVHQTSSATPGAVTIATLTIGGVSGTFSVTTAAVLTQQVTITTSPAGLSFIADGVTYTSPRTFTWTQGSSHAIATTSSQAGAAGTRYTLTSWSDGGVLSHTIIVPPTTTTYTANFRTEYLLTTAASPVAAGTVSPVTGNWYPAGAIVPVKAFTNAGWYSFVSWSGTVANSSNVATTVTITGPQSIIVNFANSPLLTAAFSAKSTLNALTLNVRTWGIKVSNSGLSTALATKLTGLTLTQTFGAACTPVITPTQFPLLLGDIIVGGSATGAVTIDFSSCAATARFTATLSYSSNSGTVIGSKGYANQFR